MRTARFLVSTLLVLVLTTVASADGKITPRSLIDQLSSSKYAERKAADEQLRQAGSDAIPMLLQAAAHADLEVAHRAMQILKARVQKQASQDKSNTCQLLSQIAGDSGAGLSGWAIDKLTRLAEGGSARRTAFWGSDPASM